MPTPDDRAQALFEATLGTATDGAARVLGRLNPIGDYSDDNGGAVLPIATNRDTHLAFRPQTDTLVHIVAEHGETAEFDFIDLLRAADV